MPRATLVRALSFAFPALAIASVLHASILPGRSWTPIFDLTHPQVGVFGNVDPLSDPDGRPALLVTARRLGAEEFTFAVLSWRDSVWGDSIWSQQQGPGSGLRIVPSPNGGLVLLSLSRTIDVNGYVRLLLWRLGASFSAPETVAVATWQLGNYAFDVALGQNRRWVTRIEQPPNETFQVRTYLSDVAGQWQSVARQGTDELNCALIPVDDTTAVLMYTGYSGGWWTTLHGAHWDPLQALPNPMFGPTVRRNPEGGSWVVSMDGRDVHVDSWTGTEWGDWVTMESMREPPWLGEPSGVASVYPSLGPGRPAIAWMEWWNGKNPVPCGPGYWCYPYLTAPHVAWPLENGWSPGYQVPTSDDMGIGPSVALDRNDDVWLFWSIHHETTQRWVHSYVSATSSAPDIVPAGASLRIDWTLSESAPESWWAVLRDPGTGTFQEVARVKAGDDTHMSWLDTGVPAPSSGALRYRIRRESVDARFGWMSPAANWGTGTQGLRLSAARNPSGAQAALVLRGFPAGPVQLQILDAGGRLVGQNRIEVSNEGTNSIPLDLSNVRPGVYWVVAKDASGRTSPALKLVRLN